LKKLTIVSGGQTGTDRGALDFALYVKLPCTGFCPKGRIAEDGVIPARYPLRETSSPLYETRTMGNVIHSDGTLVFRWKTPFGEGTRQTIEFCKKHRKPLFVFNLNISSLDEQMDKLNEWINRLQVERLNIAGNRESQDPGLYEQTYRALTRFYELYF